MSLVDRTLAGAMEGDAGGMIGVTGTFEDHDAALWPVSIITDGQDMPSAERTDRITEPERMLLAATRGFLGRAVESVRDKTTDIDKLWVDIDEEVREEAQRFIARAVLNGENPFSLITVRRYLKGQQPESIDQEGDA